MTQSIFYLFCVYVICYWDKRLMLKWLAMICLNCDRSYLRSFSKIVGKLSDDLRQLKGIKVFSYVVRCWPFSTGCYVGSCRERICSKRMIRMRCLGLSSLMLNFCQFRNSCRRLSSARKQWELQKDVLMSRRKVKTWKLM